MEWGVHASIDRDAFLAKRFSFAPSKHTRIEIDTPDINSLVIHFDSSFKYRAQSFANLIQCKISLFHFCVINTVSWYWKGSQILQQISHLFRQTRLPRLPLSDVGSMCVNVKNLNIHQNYLEPTFILPPPFPSRLNPATFILSVPLPFLRRILWRKPFRGFNQSFR